MRKETFHIKEQSVRVDFDSSDEANQDDYLGGIKSKDKFYQKYKGKHLFLYYNRYGYK
jgi:hypothetical protein